MFEGEEEIGSPHLQACMQEHKERLHADAVVSADSVMWAHDTPSLVLGSKGLIALQIDVRGAESDLHSGLHGGLAPNPLNALTTMLGSMWTRDGKVQIEGFYDEVRPLSEQERAEIAAVPFDEAGYARSIGIAAHQYEGGNTNNQWYRWEQQGHVRLCEHSGKAAKWWEYAESDFDLAERMHHNALRLSLEWSRIEPKEGQWDSGAIDRYRAMLRDLHDRAMKPIVTLHHFTEPVWFADQGGFENEDNIRFFVRYVTHVVQNLSDLCDFWLTINEPNVYTALGYVLGSYPPGKHDWLVPSM